MSKQPLISADYFLIIRPSQDTQQGWSFRHCVDSRGTWKRLMIFPGHCKVGVIWTAIPWYNYTHGVGVECLGWWSTGSCSLYLPHVWLLVNWIESKMSVFLGPKHFLTGIRKRIWIAGWTFHSWPENRLVLLALSVGHCGWSTSCRMKKTYVNLKVTYYLCWKQRTYEYLLY